MHNFKTVYSFEFLRNIKKPTFWVAAFAMPVILAVVSTLLYFSNKTSVEKENELASSSFSVGVLDETGIITDQSLTAHQAQRVATQAQGIQDVENKKLEAFFYYPKDMASTGIQVYNQNAGLSDNSKYTKVATMLLQNSADSTVTNPTVLLAVQDKVPTHQTNYQDGKPINLLGKAFVPALLTVALYAVIILLGNQIIASMTEEKENRLTEILLTSVSSRSVLAAKIAALFTLGLIQIALILVTGFIGYLVAKNIMPIPDIKSLMSQIEFNPANIAAGLAILICGLFALVGLLITVGSLSPTIKEANQFVAPIYICLFFPLYLSRMIVSQPESGVVQFLSYFPLTSPLVLSIRNTVGNLEPWQLGLSLATLIIFGAFSLKIAATAFKRGSLEYSKTLSLKSLFQK